MAMVGMKYYKAKETTEKRNVRKLQLCVTAVGELNEVVEEGAVGGIKESCSKI